MRIFLYIFGIFVHLFLVPNASIGQLTIHSYGIDMGSAVNAISVGYQNFESLGMGTNFINEGQPELSPLQPLIGCSIIMEYTPFLLMGRISHDNRSGIIQDEFVQNSPAMKPHLSYLTLESALMIEPWKNISAYGGPSLSFLINNQIGSIGDKSNNSPLSGMNSPIPGIFGGISANIPLRYFVNQQEMTISPFIETSLLFDQRTGEFPENQDGFDNIWTTASFRMGLRLSLSAKKTPIIEHQKETFDLHIPDEFSGKRSMIEKVPLLETITIAEAKQLFDTIQRYPQSLLLSHNILCSAIDPIQQGKESKDQRICPQKRLFQYIGHHLKKKGDTLSLYVCSSEQSEIQRKLLGLLHTTMSISMQRLRINTCEGHTIHQEIIKWNMSSGDMVNADIELESVTPSENIMQCTFDAASRVNNWEIQIEGPREFSMNLGPFNRTTQYFDGSSLLLGAAGSGLYSWNVNYKTEDNIQQNIRKEFVVTMTNANKMQGHAFLYPNALSDSIMVQMLNKDLQNHLKPDDEIIIVVDESQENNQKGRVAFIIKMIEDYRRLHNMKSKKNIAIIRKGGDLKLYDMNWSWGIRYEEALRLEFIH